ncbi:hypothetical protein Ciccas_001297 [Cichlidogyrus casuarinus]|uniref:Uncharacterized protein n=1 Tax=Cichlidogyrus casuarinus TaxID=1844966 RepID=A0ABD2QKE8_9PLAT
MVIYFVHSHLTVTVTICLLLAPKFWYLYRRPAPSFGPSARSRPSGLVAPGSEHLLPANKLNLLSNGGDMDFTDTNLADMDPEIIRVSRVEMNLWSSWRKFVMIRMRFRLQRELRRIYTQIEIYKTKAMRKDNPHVSKRRGGRKQRRFSLQPFHKKHHGHGGGQQMLIQSDSGSGLMNPSTAPGSAIIMPESQSARYPSMEDGSEVSVLQPSGRPKVAPSKSSDSSGKFLGSKSGGRAAQVILDEEYSRMSEESSNSAVDEPTSLNLHMTNQVSKK